ncbi:MAG: complex I subunit 4 family protein, partial [Acidimicrobiales bacterium]
MGATTVLGSTLGSTLAAEGVSFSILPAMIAVPVATAILIALLPASRPDYTKLAALVGSTITGAISIYLLWNFEAAEGGFQFVTQRDWVASLGLTWFLAVDGISLFLVVLTGILFPIAILTTDPHHDPKPYYMWLMMLMAGSMGAFMALDLLLFFLFFEVVLVPMYFLIGGWGHGNRVYAAMKFFLYTMAASALMLVGIVSLVLLASGDTDGPTFDVTVLAENHDLSRLASFLVFGSFALAFAVKVPMFPLHTWLPDAHTEAPTAGSVILAGVMLKLGTYGLLRFGLYLFPEV